jgi:ParB/RepB/Spo0J family partition protein
MPDIRVEGGNQIRRLYRIDPSLIVVSTGENSRADSEQGIEALAQSFLDHDQQEPCGVRRLTDARIGEEEKVKLTFGFRRYFAAMRINEKNLTGKYRTDGQAFKLLCVVSDQEDDEQAFLSTLTENSERLDLTPIDQARTIQRLEVFGRTRAEIATILKKSQGWISETLSLLELPGWCQAYVASGVLAASSAYDLVKIPEMARKSVLQWVKRVNGKMSRADIQRALEGYDLSPVPYDLSPLPHGETPTVSLPETHSSLAEPPEGFGREPALSEGAADFGKRFEALAQYGDGPTAATGDAENQAKADTIAAQETPSPPKRQPAKSLKLKPRTTRELRDIAQGKAKDEEAPANVRSASELLVQLISRKIGEKAYFAKLEGLLKTRPV